MVHSLSEPLAAPCNIICVSFTMPSKEVKVGYEGAKESLVTQGLSTHDVVVSENGLLLAREFRIASKMSPSL